MYHRTATIRVAAKNNFTGCGSRAYRGTRLTRGSVILITVLAVIAAAAVIIAAVRAFFVSGGGFNADPQPIPPQQSSSVSEQPAASSSDPAVSQPEPEPEPEPEPVMGYKTVRRRPQKEELKDAGFFNNSVFIGDSLSEGLLLTDIFDEGTTVIAQKGMTARKVMKSPEMLEGMHPDRIYILLGINDLCNYNASVEYHARSYGEMLDYLIESFPESEIIVQSVFPLALKYKNEKTKLTNEKIDEFNARICELCEQKGPVFVDLSTSFKAENGFMYDEMTSDGLHLRASYYPFWLNLLMESTTPVVMDGGV